MYDPVWECTDQAGCILVKTALPSMRLTLSIYLGYVNKPPEQAVNELWTIGYSFLMNKPFQRAVRHLSITQDAFKPNKS